MEKSGKTIGKKLQKNCKKIAKKICIKIAKKICKSLQEFARIWNNFDGINYLIMFFKKMLQNCQKFGEICNNLEKFGKVWKNFELFGFSRCRFHGILSNIL